MGWYRFVMFTGIGLGQGGNKYRTISFSERDKGDRFERLMQGYLKTDPRYAFKFKNVWMWNEFPGKLDRMEKKLNK